MGWIYLLIAGIFEVGWPLGLKFAQDSEYKIWWILFAVITMALSGYFLFFAQKYIPIGTAYAVWTGIGTIGTFLLGILIGVFLILAGIIILKLSH